MASWRCPSGSNTVILRGRCCKNGEIGLRRGCYHTGYGCLLLLRPSWGHVEPSWGDLGSTWEHLGPSWGSSWGHLGLLGAILAVLGAVLGSLGAIFGPSWDHLGPLGVVLGPPQGPAKFSLLSLLLRRLLLHSSAMLEMLFQAWELSTFSALPVPMLRQVYVGVHKW